ncbi:MAG: hypothetical protein ACTSVR_04830 [Candidatus Thorarchaeota archaeon]
MMIEYLDTDRIRQIPFVKEMIFTSDGKCKVIRIRGKPKTIRADMLLNVKGSE